ncbi:hypothetical protein F4801DRAFT_204900 [Xylaria longipes]|nr:hypothetical protein F4801DRAFT_204900 [Xylaria longipes]
MAKREDVDEGLPRNVPQDTPVNSQRNPSPMQLKLEDLIRTVLGQRFEIGELRDENKNNHFVAFTVRLVDVKVRATTDDTNKHVARVYEMNDLTPKHKRYKIRSINRSAARTVFKTTWNSCQIIILELGLLDDPPSSTDAETARFDTTSPNPKTNDKNDLSLGTSETRVASVGNGRLLASAPLSIKSNIASLEQKPKLNPMPKQKTNYQRESSRLRQRDKRAAKRHRQRYVTHNTRTGLNLQPQPLSEILALKENVHGLDDATFTTLVILHIAFDPRPELKTQLPPVTQSQIEQFLAARSLKVVLSNDDEKSEFVQLKENELVGLRRLTKKLNGLTQQCHDELHSLLQEQISTTEGSTHWRHLQEHLIDPRKHWHTVLLSASKVLPMLTAKSEKLIDSLKRELREASELKKKRRNLNHRQWIHHLIPASEAYNQLFGALKYS